MTAPTPDPLDLEAVRLGYDHFAHLICICYLPDATPPIITLCGLDRTHDQELSLTDDTYPECIACVAYRDDHKTCPRCGALY